MCSQKSNEQPSLGFGLSRLTRSFADVWGEFAAEQSRLLDPDDVHAEALSEVPADGDGSLPVASAPAATTGLLVRRPETADEETMTELLRSDILVRARSRNVKLQVSPAPQPSAATDTDELVAAASVQQTTIASTQTEATQSQVESACLQTEFCGDNFQIREMPELHDQQCQTDAEEKSALSLECAFTQTDEIVPERPPTQTTENQTDAPAPQLKTAAVDTSDLYASSRVSTGAGDYVAIEPPVHQTDRSVDAVPDAMASADAAADTGDLRRYKHRSRGCVPPAPEVEERATQLSGAEQVRLARVARRSRATAPDAIATADANTQTQCSTPGTQGEGVWDSLGGDWGSAGAEASVQTESGTVSGALVEAGLQTDAIAQLSSQSETQTEAADFLASAALESGRTRESVGCNTEYTVSCQLGRKRGVRHKALDTCDLCAHLLLERSGAASTEAQTESSEAFAAGTARSMVPSADCASQTEWPEAIAECAANATATQCPDEADAVQTEVDAVCAVVPQSDLQPAHATATASAAAAATAQRTEAGGDWDEADLSLELEDECTADSAAGEQQIAGDESDAEPHPHTRYAPRVRVPMCHPHASHAPALLLKFLFLCSWLVPFISIFSCSRDKPLLLILIFLSFLCAHSYAHIIICCLFGKLCNLIL